MIKLYLKIKNFIINYMYIKDFNKITKEVFKSEKEAVKEYYNNIYNKIGIKSIK